MKVFMLGIVAVLGLISFNCALPGDAIPYQTNVQEHAALIDAFGSSITNYIESHTFLSNERPDNPMELAFYRSWDRNIIVYQSNLDGIRQFLYIVHEATHYYQDVYLHHILIGGGDYNVPTDLSHELTTEQEAEIVRRYEYDLQTTGIKETNFFNYMNTFMALPKTN